MAFCLRLISTSVPDLRLDLAPRLFDHRMKSFGRSLPRKIQQRWGPSARPHTAALFSLCSQDPESKSAVAVSTASVLRGVPMVRLGLNL